MGMKAVKFGGTSLCSAAQMKKAAEIVLADADRRVVVVSAPGKRSPEDEKITDLLYRCYEEADDVKKACLFEKIRERFDGIISDLVEAIGKDLIHDAALHPFRRMIFFIVDGDLPAYQIYLRHKCAVAEVSAAEIFITDAEIIKIETGLMETERHTKSVFSAIH